MAKSSHYFLPWLPSWQGHFHGLVEQSEREKRDNQYLFGILRYRCPSMQMLQQLSFVELLMVKGICVCENAQVEEQGLIQMPFVH